MKSIIGKFTLTLITTFTLGVVSINLFINNYFHNNFYKFIEKDMAINYKSSKKNLYDYLNLNNIEGDILDLNNINSNAMQFILERVQCESILYDVNGRIMAKAVSNEDSIDLKIYENIPPSFENVKSDKAILDVEIFDNRAIGKLSYCIYGEDNRVIGILTLVREYSNEYLENKKTQSILNFAIIILLTIVFIGIYLLTRKIIKPLIELRKEINNIGKGDMPKELQINSDDEIGILINSFNEMIVKLREKEKKEIDFFRNITHEFKTPLTNISGYAQLIELNERESDFNKEAINRIVSESNRLNKLVVDLLDIKKENSTINEYLYEDIHLKDIINEVLLIKDIEIIAKNLKVIKDLDNIVVKGNKKQLIILFNNLIGNSVKYSFNNTKIKIVLKNGREESDFILESIGKKIPPEMKDTIFEPFTRIQEEGFSDKTGNGLGLYICNNIIKGHKWMIKVEVNDTKTIFYIKIPNGNNLATKTIKKGNI